LERGGGIAPKVGAGRKRKQYREFKQILSRSGEGITDEQGFFPRGKKT